jgi:hypothetical protein
VVEFYHTITPTSQLPIIPDSAHLEEIGLDLTMSGVFEVFKWLAILVMSFVWKDTPFIKKTRADSRFIKGVWLDILDATIFGSQYVVGSIVLNPAHGIRPDGRKPHGQVVDKTFSTAVWLIWLVGIVTSLLGPTLYIFFGYLDAGDDRDEETLADVTDRLMKSVRLLDKPEAIECAKDAIRMQLKDYDETHDDVEERLVCVKKRGKSGIATYNKDRGVFDVKYDDGQVERVSINELEPAEEEEDAVEEMHKAFDKGCCKGWFAPSYLRPKNKNDTWERVSEYLDTFRSFFFVELPFGCIRGYFEIYLGMGLPSLFLMKNIAWGITDFMLLLSCGNEKATCFSATPIELVQSAVKGSPLDHIAIGPKGMWAQTAQITERFAKSSLKGKKQLLTYHKAWLLLQRQKAERLGSEEGKNVAVTLQEFDRAIDQFDERIRVIAAQMAKVRTTDSR